jgi:hyperosmotically inducible periplasmic protein
MKVSQAMYRVVLMVVTVVLFGGCATSTGRSTEKISAPVRASEMDDRIESSARKSYVFRTYLQGDDIKISSKNGVVTLTGVVSYESRKALAQETVAGLPGVKSVDNRLGIKGASPTPNSDAWLSERVRTALLFHRNVSGSTTVHVQDGIVTLRGEASSQAQKELTTEYAKDVEGVKDVKNEMTMPPTPKTTSEFVMESIDDASITALVKMTLLTHRSTSALRTKVETNEGVVTLNGKAKNATEKELVTKLVNDINGVRSINNRMTIE